jgi:chromosome segregation ATPase
MDGRDGNAGEGVGDVSSDFETVRTVMLTSLSGYKAKEALNRIEARLREAEERRQADSVAFVSMQAMWEEAKTRLREAESDARTWESVARDEGQRLELARARIAELERQLSEAEESLGFEQYEVERLRDALRAADNTKAQQRARIADLEQEAHNLAVERAEQEQAADDAEARVAELEQERDIYKRRILDADKKGTPYPGVTVVRDTARAAELGQEVERLRGEVDYITNAAARREIEAREEIKRLRAIEEAARRLVDGSDWAGRDTEGLRQALGVHAG